MMRRSLIASTIAVTMVGSTVIAPASSYASMGNNGIQVTHGPQGTGNYKGKRDRHEKPGPMNEKKRKRPGWIFKR